MFFVLLVFWFFFFTNHHITKDINCTAVAQSKEKAPAAKKRKTGCKRVRNERFADGLTKRREPTCEWSKGGRPGAVRNERRGLPYVVVEGWRGFCFWLKAKTMTARSVPHEATALIARAQRRQINNSAEARSDPQASTNTAAGGCVAAERSE